MIRNTNDGTNRPPYLRVDINAGTWSELPEVSKGPRGSAEQILEVVRKAGFQGVQGMDAALCRKFGLGASTGGRINDPAEADVFAAKGKDEGFACATCHVGWGMEDDDVVDRLMHEIIDASMKHDFPIYLETHRATITQDMWRTVKLARRVPEVRFNGDFSHWYTGQEMIYGGMEKKLPFLQEVFDRTRFIHGRIGNPGCIQVDIGDGANRSYVDHFREMWIQAFAGFLNSARPGDYIIFAPELLSSKFFYARQFRDASGQWAEEGDRWEQAILYGQIARQCFAEAQLRRKAVS